MALCESVAPLFREHGIIDKLPKAPDEQAWITFQATAQAGSSAKAKGRPKKESKKKPKKDVLPKELQNIFQSIELDETSFDIQVAAPKPNSATTGELMSLPWRSWRDLDVFFNQGLSKSVEATAVAAMREFQISVPTSQLPIDIKGTHDGKLVKVVATADMPKGALQIPLCASKMARILHAKDGQPLLNTAVPIEVTVNVPHRYLSWAKAHQYDVIEAGCFPGFGVDKDKMMPITTNAVGDMPIPVIATTGCFDETTAAEAAEAAAKAESARRQTGETAAHATAQAALAGEHAATQKTPVQQDGSAAGALAPDTSQSVQAAINVAKDETDLTATQLCISGDGPPGSERTPTSKPNSTSPEAPAAASASTAPADTEDDVGEAADSTTPVFTEGDTIYQKGTKRTWIVSKVFKQKKRA